MPNKVFFLFCGLKRGILTKVNERLMKSICQVMDGVVSLNKILLKIFLTKDSLLKFRKDGIHFWLQLIIFRLKSIYDDRIFLDSFFFIFDSKLKVFESFKFERSFFVQMIDFINFLIFFFNFLLKLQFAII